jgi:HPt (histidine-containing phosphotransfer) domain-containing protein
MDSALTSGDTATLRRHAHSLKGSSGTVGATRLQALSLALEQAAARGDLAAAAERLPPVQAESAEVAVTMGGWLAAGEVR